MRSSFLLVVALSTGCIEGFEVDLGGPPLVAEPGMSGTQVLGAFPGDDGDDPGKLDPCSALSVLDFDYVFPNDVPAGKDVSSLYRNISIDTFARDGSDGLGITFDSSDPTGGDEDLGTPNEAYGGPGVGAGGETNTTAMGNVLIRAEDEADDDGDGLVDVPDDHADGATFQFTWGADVCVSDLSLIDVEASEVPTVIAMYDRIGNEIAGFEAGGLGDNSFELVDFQDPAETRPGTCNVRVLTVTLQGSGALDDVAYCADIL